MPLQVAKSKWEALAQRTKAIILAVVSLGTIISMAWVIDARYAKAGEFRTFQLEIYEERIKDQIKSVEYRKARTDCRDPRNRDMCQWLDDRIRYWEQQLRRLEQKR